jgi:hypothetical protein
MADRLSALEQQLLDLQRKLERLEKRMDAGGLPAERAWTLPGTPASPPQTRGEDEESGAIAFDFTSFLTLSGRSLIILGGGHRCGLAARKSRKRQHQPTAR